MLFLFVANQRQSESHLCNSTTLQGKRVKFGRSKNVTTIKQLYQWMQEYKLMPDVVKGHTKNNKKSRSN